jgi:flavin reductase (DIM6/NTAB) family NADH-FMN oxidoreductase RutF
MELNDMHYTQHLDRTLRRMADGGLLLATQDEEGNPNVMTIGWGNVGIIWGRPIFLVFVRPSRYTFRNLRVNDDFVVNVPTEYMGDVCAVCGSESGRNVDKFEECSLTTSPAETVNAPLIEQCERFYECRTIHMGDVRDSMLRERIRDNFYGSGDLHRVYYGEILRTAERID